MSAKYATRSIEEIRVGQRVLGENPDLAEWEHSTRTEVDPATWRLVRLHAVGRWDDGTLDTIEIETLQPLSWLLEQRARVGRSVPIPCDLEELALPLDLRGDVVAIEPCPELEQAPGHIVLLTVNHLNNTVCDLTVTDAAGHRETIGATAIHRFYSDTRHDWAAAASLRIGERLPGIDGPITVEDIADRDGVERVYNLTVEGEHVYHVAGSGALVHNAYAGGAPFSPDQQALIELANEASLGGRRPINADSANNLLDWADEVGLTWRAGPGDLGIGGPANWVGGPHIHIWPAGRGGHLPVGPGVPPR